MSDTLTSANTNAFNINETSIGGPLPINSIRINDIDGISGTVYIGNANTYEDGKRVGRKEIIDIINKEENYKFGGAFTSYKIGKDNLTATSIYINRVIYSNPAVIVFWSDGTKTVAKCSKQDTYNPEFGLLLCYCYRTIGKEKVAKLIHDWVMYENGVRTLADVRKDHRK